DAAGEQGPLDRVRRLAGGEEVLDLDRQRLQEGGAGRRRQVEQRRGGFLLAVDPGGEGGVVDVAGQDQCGRPHAVAVLYDDGDRPAGKGRPARRRRELPAIVADVADIQRRAPPERVLQQFPRPDAVVARLPDGVALQARDRLDALLRFIPRWRFGLVSAP